METRVRPSPDGREPSRIREKGERYRMSTYVVGDIQGCFDPLRRLLDKVNFDPAADALWCPGDLVNRGGQSLEVLRLFHELGDRAVVTLGNHDLALLRHDERHPEGDSPIREFRAVFAAPDREALMEWLRNRPLAHWSDAHGVLMVHAGVIPAWKRKQTLKLAGEVAAAIRSPARGQFFRRMYGNRPKVWKKKRKGYARLRFITNVLTRIRFCDIEGRMALKLSGPPGSQPYGYLPWYAHPERLTRGVHILFGHWAALGFHQSHNVTCLDSGCVWGGKLTALRLEDRAVFRVKSKRKKVF